MLANVEVFRGPSDVVLNRRPVIVLVGSSSMMPSLRSLKTLHAIAFCRTTLGTASIVRKMGDIPGPKSKTSTAMLTHTVALDEVGC